MGSVGVFHKDRSKDKLITSELDIVYSDAIIEEDSKLPSCIDDEQITISFKSMALTTATCQISALIFCLVWSVKFHFKESTATHCRVTNYLPSLSATLDFTPQRDVWRTCIGLFGLPRYIIAYLYFRLIFRSRIVLLLNWAEMTSLIGLSIVDSIRYFGEFTYMFLLIFLYTH